MTPPRVPLLFLPGLLCDEALFAPQLAGLVDLADLRVARLAAHDTMAALAADALGAGAVAALRGCADCRWAATSRYEILRQAPGRVRGLALLDTSARPDSPEATDNRRRLMALAERDFPAVIETLLPKLMHPEHVADRQARRNRAGHGGARRARGVRAPGARDHPPRRQPARSRVHPVSVDRDRRRGRRADPARGPRRAGGGNPRRRARARRRSAATCRRSSSPTA